MNARVTCITAACLAMACGLARAQPAALVTPDWLMAHLDDPGVRIIDLGKSQQGYEAAHIPGAQRVDWRNDLVDPEASDYFGVAGPAKIAALLSRLGIANESTVVLYDGQSSRIAARMFWVLRYYGHDDVRILDGGSGAWARAGGQLRGGTEAVMQTRYHIDAVREEWIADLEIVAGAVERGDAVIIDARAPEFYTGATSGTKFGSDTPNARAGHVPGARNLFWADHFDELGMFKPVDELRAQYAAAGVTAETAVVTYCHIGLQGATPWFVLTGLLGYRNVRLYDYSMAEWANAPDTTTVVIAN